MYLCIYCCVYIYIPCPLAMTFSRLRKPLWVRGKTLRPFVLCHHLIRCWVGKKGRVSSSPAPWYSSTPYTPYTHIGSPVFNFYLIAFVDSNCRSRIVLRLLFYSFVSCVFPILFHISAFYGASLSMWGLWGDRVTGWQAAVPGAGVGALCVAPARVFLSFFFFASVSTLRCFCSCRRRKFPISVAVAIMWGLSK